MIGITGKLHCELRTQISTNQKLWQDTSRILVGPFESIGAVPRRSKEVSDVRERSFNPYFSYFLTVASVLIAVLIFRVAPLALVQPAQAQT